MDQNSKLAWSYIALILGSGFVAGCTRAPLATEVPAPSLNVPQAEPPPASLTLLAGGLGGQGNADGLGAAARFTSPYGIVVDPDGNLYVADQNNASIRKIEIGSDRVTTVAGIPGAALSDLDVEKYPPTALAYPSGLALDGVGDA